MIFNKHSELEGQHALLSASKHTWIKYDDKTLDDFVISEQAKSRGTKLHEYAQMAIEEGIKQRGTKQTLNAFINDAIGYRMKSEQVLFYSYYCFGTADAIGFRNNKLRIFDLKTGLKVKASMDQLKIYAALFCLEYNHDPHDIEIELRIYQFDEVRMEIGDPEEIAHIMDVIVRFDKRIEELSREES